MKTARAIRILPADVRWVSAGHGPILFYDADAKRFEELAVHDIPLGVRADWPFHENDRDTWPDFGAIVLGTDGIWEARDSHGATFGKDGLMRAIEESADLTAHQICDHVVGQLRAFAGAAAQHDDVTLVVIKFLPRRAEGAPFKGAEGAPFREKPASPART